VNPKTLELVYTLISKPFDPGTLIPNPETLHSKFESRIPNPECIYSTLHPKVGFTLNNESCFPQVRVKGSAVWLKTRARRDLVARALRVLPQAGLTPIRENPELDHKNRIFCGI